MHQSLLIYSKFRYFKLSMLLIIAAIISYAVVDPVDGHNGGTWLGYTLGGIAAFLILLLMWFGIRKRSYKSSAGRVEGWLSAHIYLGLSLIVIATLHAGFEINWNIHTLAYFLMLIVIISGIYGVVAYMRYPHMLTENRRGRTMDSMLTEMAELDRECRETASQLSDKINRAILDCIENTRIGGSVWRQLSGRDPRCATLDAYKRVKAYSDELSLEHSDEERRLLTLLSNKLELVQRARRDVQFKAMMDIWLYFHVPLSFALLAALIAHVVAVFFYW